MSTTIEKERMDFKKLIIENPNYFGSVPELKIPAKSVIKGNTKYEELKCIGFYPDTDTLEAIIQIKLAYGYQGNLCTNGSYEYIRFYVDWDGSGTFKSAASDVGLTRINVHDIPDEKMVCLTEPLKPISYAAYIKINPVRHLCTQPNMVKVRAILAWETPPPPHQPNYNPPWGNVIEKWIQIKPRKIFLKDVVTAAELKKINLTPTMIDLSAEVSMPQMMEPAELKELYKNENIPEHRHNFAALAQMAEKIKNNPTLAVQYKLNPEYESVLKNLAPLLYPETSNTTFEELDCVGSVNVFGYDMLVATLTVKKPSGYSGTLCTKGSYEYVAFWAYVWDQIEQMCAWIYIGVTSVNVHDIKNMPKEGLQYAVYLPCDFSYLKDKCSKPKIIKIRAILSWQVPPPKYNHNFIPVWGNRMDALIQLKPKAKPVVLDQVPYISDVGSMAVTSISGNPDSTYTTPLGDGFAEGPSIGGGFTADDSPFGGTIEISGHISNPPDDPSNATKLKYKVQYKKPGMTGWKDITNGFWIWISKWTWDPVAMVGVWTQSPQYQTSTDGYFTYEEDLTPPVERFVEGNTLAEWITPVSEGDGLYLVRMLLQKSGAPAIQSQDVPADHVQSNIVSVMIDNTPPKADLYLDIDVNGKSCHEFTKGDALYASGITGKFTATDVHISRYSLWIEPAIANAPTISPTFEIYPLFTGAINKNFIINITKDTAHCGYVVNLEVWDRTIVNNSGTGNASVATLGLCLREPEPLVIAKPILTK